MANTLSVKTFRDKYRSASLAQLLRRALIAEAICEVDRSGAKTIQNPYGNQPTVTVQALAGTYGISTFTTTDSTLTVTYEVIVAEHVFDFEDTLSRFELFSSRMDEQNFAVAAAIDKYVLNTLVANAGQAYTAPTGGFGTSANVPVIVANLISKVAGFSETYRGLYLVLENIDLVGVIATQVGSGFSYADSALRNGLITTYMGVDMYVTRHQTFFTGTLGDSFTNQGKRLFGVKRATTYAEPRGIRFEEKGVSGKTGMEVVTFGYIGAKVWANNSELTIAITNAGASQSASSSKSPSLSPSQSPS